MYPEYLRSDTVNNTDIKTVVTTIENIIDILVMGSKTERKQQNLLTVVFFY